MAVSANLFSCAAVSLICLASSAAWGQRPPPVTPPVSPIGEPIDRPKEDDQQAAALRPVGARLGSFTFLPKAEFALAYDNNIYALENRTDDLIGRISPSVAVSGDFNLYTLNLAGSLDRLEYESNGSESRTNWRVDGSQRYELARQTYLTSNASYRRNHEDRGDPNSVATNLKPTRFSLAEFGGGLSRDLARLRAGLRGNYRYYNYNDALQINDIINNNDDRDRSEYLAEGRVGYEFSPGYNIITRLAYDRVDYRTSLDDAGFNRDSDGIRVSGGVQFELSRLLTGEVTGGYLWRSYEDARFQSVERPAFGASLTWFPTELTAVEFQADRTVEETIAPGYRGFVANSFSLRAEHELLRTLLLRGALRYIENRYLRGDVGDLLKRGDDFYGISVAARYTLNRNLYVNLGYDWNKRTSNSLTPGSSFTRNRVSATIGTQF